MPEITDYSQYQTAEAIPDASSMLETFRAIGYDINAAIADIIDNSITAGAQNIWVDYNWAGRNTSVSVVDDGIGMNSEELIQAMKPGSKNPADLRPADDLGRFGMGLKTASFSQCRKFCVVSKKTDYAPAYWTWDIDHVLKVKAWQLVHFCPEGTLLERIQNCEHGTAVYWWDLDRAGLDNVNEEKNHEKFMNLMSEVKLHLSMVFHRFISRGTKIYFNNRLITSWDPFLASSAGTQLKPEMSLSNGDIVLKGFVLPHRSKLTGQEYDLAKGPKGSWTDQQGFYIYRNERLLVGGNWLGLFKNEHHFDLCRIRIDLPNYTDEAWQIDIKKSTARPPAAFKEQIASYAREVRSTAEQLYRHRGKAMKRNLPANDYQPVWEEIHKHNKRFYKINRQHPVVKEVLGEDDSLRQSIRRLLAYVEDTVPVPTITMSENRKEEEHGSPVDGDTKKFIIEGLKQLYAALTAKGHSLNEIKSIIGRIEPYDHFLAEIENIENL